MPTLLAATCTVAAVLAAAAGAGRDASGSSAPPQPYLSAIARPTTLPPLRPVTVAVVDTGVDGRHPDLAGRIAGARPFAKGDPLYPDSPHGTAVAGLIGAIDRNGVGIEGIAPNARLLVADVSGGDSSFDPDAIARAIRWAADRHARVINLSLEGLGPVPAYTEAIDYAVARGVLVVAAAGNCFDRNFAQCTPSGYTQAPAWMPHVLTVGATTGTSRPSDFSIPSARWVDIAAPGELVTTLWPTRNNPYFATPDCPFLGTTACYSTGGANNGPWGPSGTSYAAPMVSAAAAILFGADPRLQPGQVATLLEQTAVRLADPRHQSGAGLVDIAAALRRVEAGSVPSADFGETNDTPATATPVPAGGVIRATLDSPDDPLDVYRVTLRRGQTVTLRSSGPVRGTISVAPGGAAGPIGKTLRFTAGHSGAYILSVAPARDASGAYRLALSRR